MKTLTVNTYRYSELTDDAKERARDWYRNASAGDFDYDFLYDNVAAIAPLLGLELATRPVKLMNGSTRHDPAISFNVAFSQGDGASFEGTWRAANSPKTKRGKPLACPVKTPAPQDGELARICRELSRLSREFPDLVGIVTDHHYYGMRTECESEAWDAARYPEQGERDDARVAAFEQAAEDVEEAMRDFADWIYKFVRAEVEYQSSDDVVAETIEANEYEFAADGAHA